METIEEKLSSLEKQVLNLNVIAKVIIGVAVVFGVAGGWGYKILSGAKEDLKNLTDKVQTAESFFNDLEAKAEKSLNEFSELRKKELQSLVDTWPEGDYCIVMKEPCPDGFSSGGLYFDTDDSNPQNKWTWVKPNDTKKGAPSPFKVGNNIIINFCCKD